MSLTGIMAGAAYIKLTMNDAQAMQALDRTKSNLKSFAAAARTAGDTLTLVSAPLITVVNQFAKFSDTMLQVKAISQASGSELAGLEKLASELGRTTAFTSTQVAQGMAEFARMGFTSQEITQSIRPALDLVRATGEEMWRLGEFTEFATSVLRIFNLQTNQFTRVADVLTQAANKSSVSIADLGMSLKIVGPSAKAMGESLESTTALLMTLADTGIRGSEAGTMLRRVFQALAEQSAEGKEAAQHLRNLGIELKTAGGKARSARAVFVDIAQKMKEMTDIEKVNFSVDVFDLRGSAAALNLVEFSSKLAEAEKGLQGAEGAAKRAAGEMESGLGGAVRLLNSAFQELGNTISKQFSGPLGDLLSVLTSVMQGMKSFIENNSAGIVTLTKMALILGVVGGSFKVLFSVLHGAKQLYAPIRELDAMLRRFRETQAAKAAAPSASQANLAAAQENVKIAAAKRADAVKQELEARAALREKTNAVNSAGMVVWSEQQKLAAIKARYAAAEQAAQTSSAEGGSASASPLAAVGKEMKAQEKVVAKAIADRNKLIKQEELLRTQVQNRAAATASATAVLRTESMAVIGAANADKIKVNSLTRVTLARKMGNLTAFQQAKMSKLLQTLSVKEIALAYKQAGSSAVAATAKALWGKANLALGATFKKLWATMAANPIGAILTAISLAVMAINHFIEKNKEAQQQAAALAKANAERSGKRRQKEKEIRNEGVVGFERLKQLEEKSNNYSLSLKEIKEAEELIEQLAPFGADKWTSLDKITGKLNLLKDAFVEFAKEAKKRELQKIDDQIKNTEKQIDKYYEVVNIVRPLAAGTPGTGPRYLVEKRRQKRDNLSEQEIADHEAANEKLAELKKERIKIEKNSAETLVQTMQTTAERVAQERERIKKEQEDFDKAFDEAAKIEQENADKNKGKTQLELDALRKKREEYKKYIDLLIEEQIRLRSANLKKGDMAAVKKNTQEIFALQNRLQKQNKNFDQQESDIYVRRNERDSKYSDFIGNLEEENRKERLSEEKNEQYENLRKTGGDAAGFARQQMMRFLKLYQQEKARYNHAVKLYEEKDSEGGSDISESEGNDLMEMQTTIRALRDQFKDYKNKFKDAQKATEEKVSSTGAWSFAELYGKIGGASAQERTAKATEQALPWLKKINDNTQRKSGSFVVSYE